MFQGLIASQTPSPYRPHVWDDDGCCERCGHDGAEEAHHHSALHPDERGQIQFTPCKESPS